MDVTLENLDYLFALKHWPRPIDFTQLHGDASARCYYRIVLDDRSTRILMTMPEGAMSASEEISNFAGQLAEPSFVLLERNLRSAGIRTPQIQHFDAQRRWMVLEDLGDMMFYTHVRHLSANDRLPWYRRAIELLVEMQQRMADIPASECIAHQRSFDAELLNWEFMHFAEYALDARGAPLSAPDLATFRSLTEEITQHILHMPQGFVHRDFQSKNLMIHQGELAVIDFQDALTGSYVYDLVALLRDSYIVLSNEQLGALLQYYAELRELNVEHVTRDFHLQTLQRKMKDAGRFVYIDQVKGNPSFMQYMNDTIDYVQHALTQLPEYGELYKILTPYVPEWNKETTSLRGAADLSA